jgi:hypothetical protein
MVLYEACHDARSLEHKVWQAMYTITMEKVLKLRWDKNFCSHYIVLNAADSLPYNLVGKSR